jgi:hypothetical protein
VSRAAREAGRTAERGGLNGGKTAAAAASAAGRVAAQGGRDGGNAAASAIRNKKLSVTVPVSVRTGATYINGRLFQMGVNHQQVYSRAGQAMVAS